MKYPVIEVVSKDRSVLTCRNVCVPADDQMLVDTLILPVDVRDKQAFSKEITAPYIPGGGFIGIVKALGEKAAAVFGTQAGDLVYVERNMICGKCKPCMTGHYSACLENMQYGTAENDGAAAEKVLVGAGSRVHKLDKSVDLDVLSLLPLAELAVSAVLDKMDGVLGKNLLITKLDLFTALCGLIARKTGFTSVALLENPDDLSGYERDICDAFNITLNERENAGVFGHFDAVIDSFQNEQLSVSAVKKMLPLGRYVVGMPHREVLLPAEWMARHEIQMMGINSASWSTEKAIRLLTQNEQLLRTTIDFRHFGLANWEKAIRAGEENSWCKQIIVSFRPQEKLAF